MINNLAKRRSGIVSLLSQRAPKDRIVTMIKENVDMLEGTAGQDNISAGSDTFFYKRKSSVQIDPHTKRIIFNRESSTSSSSSRALDSDFDTLADMGVDQSTLDRLRTLSPGQQEQIVQRMINEAEDQDQVAVTSVELVKCDDLETLDECFEFEDTTEMPSKKRLSKKISGKSNVCTIS